MLAFLELVKLDSFAFKGWFRKQTVSKIIVSLSYLVVLLGVALGVYAWSNAFFRYVAPYESFGQQTSLYILKGAFAILLWIGILSSLISTVTFLLTPSRHTDHLLTLPISSLILSLRASLNSVLINLFLLVISVFPLILAYTHNLFGSLAMLIIMTLFTQTIGQSLGYAISLIIHQKYGHFLAFIIGLLLLVFTWVILRFIFPPELKLLGDLSSTSFNDFFIGLPLIRNFWLGTAFLSLALGQFVNSLGLILGTIILIIVSINIQAKLFTRCWQSQKNHLSTYKKPAPGLGKLRNLNLVTKDLLSIFRNPGNIGYLLFLISMIIVFFGLFGQGYRARGVPERFRVDSLAFSFAWLIFFAGTYFIRLTYPLGINEGQSRWWFFTIPVRVGKILASKIYVSLIVSLPIVFLAIIEWQILPFTVFPWFFGLFSFLAISLLAVVFPLIGLLKPDYSLAYQPDRASTSMSGLISIVFVSIVGTLSAYLIVISLRQTLSQGLAINGFLVFGLVSVLIVWSLAHRYLAGFNLED